MTKKQASADSYCPSYNYPFEAKNSLGNAFAPTICSSAFKAFKHRELLHINCSKNSFCNS
jgi:hypothetical protein